MTPSEIRAVGLLSSLVSEGVYTNLNERLFVERIAGRAEREPDANLTAPEAKYLRAIAEKQNIEITESEAATSTAALANLGQPATANGSAQASPESGDAGEAQDRCVSASPPIAREAALVRYDAARTALAAARSIDEVKDVHDKAAALQAYARMAEDPQLETDAAEIRLRAEHRLGELIGEAKEAGRIVEGRPKKKTVKTSDRLSSDRITLAEIGIDKNMSSRAQKVAKLNLESTVKTLRSEMASGKRGAAAAVAREAAQGGPVNGARSVMGSRVEPPNSLDYFPTAPFATRSWVEHVLPQLGIGRLDLLAKTAAEPACGEGHMSGVLEEYFGTVLASDIFDYSVEGRSPPGWTGTHDFLAGSPLDPAPDWIVTNSPFEDKALAFALAALDQAKVGVAMFHQLRWLETVERYEKLFRDRPPTLISFFVERVNLCRGRWNPEGGTATAYIWLTWVKDMVPRAPFWIPPGRREALTRPDDVARFTAHPCLPYEAGDSPPEHQVATPPATEARLVRDPSDGTVRGEVEDIPEILRRA